MQPERHDGEPSDAADAVEDAFSMPPGDVHADDPGGRAKPVNDEADADAEADINASTDASGACLASVGRSTGQGVVGAHGNVAAAVARAQALMRELPANKRDGSVDAFLAERQADEARRDVVLSTAGSLHPVSAVLDREAWLAVDAAARAQGVTMSEFVRQALLRDVSVQPLGDGGACS